jgi:hypothetical protein
MVSRRSGGRDGAGQVHRYPRSAAPLKRRALPRAQPGRHLLPPRRIEIVIARRRARRRRPARALAPPWHAVPRAIRQRRPVGAPTGVGELMRFRLRRQPRRVTGDYTGNDGLRCLWRSPMLPLASTPGFRPHGEGSSTRCVANPCTRVESPPLRFRADQAPAAGLRSRARTALIARPAEIMSLPSRPAIG